MNWLVWVAIAIVTFWVLDRVLLHLEANGCIYYRRTRGVRGRAMYHAQELDSVFNPGMQHVQEAHYREEEEEDASGDPLAGSPGNRDRSDAEPDEPLAG